MSLREAIESYHELLSDELASESFQQLEEQQRGLDRRDQRPEHRQRQQQPQRAAALAPLPRLSPAHQPEHADRHVRAVRARG